MKAVFFWITCFLAFSATAQSPVTKSYQVKAGQKVNFDFDWPKVVVSVWDKNEVSVTAQVSINDGENNDAFALEDKTEDGILTISSRIKDIKKLPRRYSITTYDGKKTTFRSKEDLNEYRRKNEANYSYTSDGPDIDITIEVKIPASIASLVKTEFGSIDAKFDSNLKMPLELYSKFGRVDVSVPAASNANLKLKTEHGEILASSLLKIDIERDMKENLIKFSNKDIKGKLNGGGTELSLRSDFGKIYLRRAG